jgi:hypothetical protein
MKGLGFDGQLCGEEKPTSHVICPTPVFSQRAMGYLSAPPPVKKKFEARVSHLQTPSTAPLSITFVRRFAAQRGISLLSILEIL